MLLAYLRIQNSLTSFKAFSYCIEKDHLRIQLSRSLYRRLEQLLLDSYGYSPATSKSISNSVNLDIKDSRKYRKALSIIFTILRLSNRLCLPSHYHTSPCTWGLQTLLQHLSATEYNGIQVLTQDLTPKLVIYDPLNPVNNVCRTTYRI